MGRIERRIFRINEDLAQLDHEEYLVQEELSVHRHLDDDARRDAAVSSHPEDRAFARDTARDVARFEKVLTRIAANRNKLVDKRQRLLDRLEHL